VSQSLEMEIQQTKYHKRPQEIRK